MSTHVIVEGVQVFETGGLTVINYGRLHVIHTPSRRHLGRSGGAEGDLG